MKKLKELNIALVHDNIRHLGGAERVLWQMKKIWPKAPIFTATIDWNGLKQNPGFINQDYITSWAQCIPFFPKYPFLYRYLLPLIWRSFDLSNFDIIVSSSGAQMSHLVQTSPTQLHICYCHTPPRHLYGFATDFDWCKFPLLKYGIIFLNKFLRRVDFQASQKVNFYIASSLNVKKRVRKYYRRDSTIIYPPVTFHPRKKQLSGKNTPGNYYLVVSRISRMKHIDLIISAMKKLKRPLIIVGTGPEYQNLKQRESHSIHFTGRINDQLLQKYYAGGRALVCAAEDEDFGITPLEALSFGKPTIAYFSGGYKETVIDGVTGVFFKSLTHESLIRTILKFERAQFKTENLQHQARRFAAYNFEKRLKSFVLDRYHEHTLSQS